MGLQCSRSLVVVIESNMRLAHTLSLLLDDWGFDALVAPTPEEALENLGDRAQCVAALIFDRHEDGRDASRAAELLSERIGFEVPVVVIAGELPGGDTFGLPVIEKPFDPQVLQRWLAAHA